MYVPLDPGIFLATFFKCGIFVLRHFCFETYLFCDIFVSDELQSTIQIYAMYIGIFNQNIDTFPSGCIPNRTDSGNWEIQMTQTQLHKAKYYTLLLRRDTDNMLIRSDNRGRRFCVQYMQIQQRYLRSNSVVCISNELESRSCLLYN